MNSTLKYTGLLALMAAVVFGATLISQYSVESPKTTTGEAGDPAKIEGMPLLFTNKEMSYDPGSPDLAHRSFQGFYEMGTNQVPVSFWFTNPHPVPVSVAVLHRSCSQCSSARLAVVSDADVQKFLAQSAAGSLTPSGLLAGLAAVSLMQSLPWQNFDLDNNPEKGIVVPAASAGGAPTLGVLQFGIDIRVNGVKRLAADVACTAGDNPQARMIFNMTVFGTEPFEVYPHSLAFGDLPEGAAPQTKNLYFWSATRATEDLKGLKVTVGDDPFLRVGQPQPLGYEELSKLAAERAASGQKLTRIQGGYRIPVTMYRQRPASASAAAASGPDIGPFEQRVGLSLPGTAHAVQIPVSATITGLVGFADGSPTVVDLKSFRALAGAQKTVALVSDRADLELSVAPKGAKPDALGVKLSEPRTDSGRRHWTLTVAVPGGSVVGELPTDSVVVLLAKTSTGVQRVRIPVKGRASTR